MKLQDKYTVLILDSHPFSLQVMKRQLEMICDATILIADSRDEVVKQIHNIIPNLIFMDLSVPNFDGSDMLLLLKSRYPSIYSDVSIIGICGLPLDGKKQDCYREVLLKPLNQEEIIRCLSTYLPNCISIKNQNNSEFNIVSDYYKRVQNMNVKIAFEYAQCDKEQFIQMVETSLHQMQNAFVQLKQKYEQSDAYQLYQVFHGIKMIFYYLGNEILGKETQELELYYKNLASRYWEDNKKFFEYLSKVEQFYDELKQANDAYISSIPDTTNFLIQTTISRELYLIKINEIIDQCNSYDYLEIIEGLKKLKSVAPKDDLSQLKRAFQSAIEFEYEDTSQILNALQKKVINREF